MNTFIESTPAAKLAITAAIMRRDCGRYAALRWAMKRPEFNFRLYRIACQLLAAERG